jgi:hypothetical protein
MARTPLVIGDGKWSTAAIALPKNDFLLQILNKHPIRNKNGSQRFFTTLNISLYLTTQHQTRLPTLPYI